MNADGTMDLLTGSFDGGQYFLQGLGAGRFAEPRPVLDKEGNRILISNYWSYDQKKWTELETSRFPGEHAISCATVDWDADGDFDLLLGARSGRLFVRVNEGNAERAEFAAHNERIGTGEETVMIPERTAMVAVADWDVDGMWDIVVGSESGAVYWLRNTGKKGKPLFSAPGKLVNAPAEGAPAGDETVRPGKRTQVWVGDYNADGLPDLLMGDNHSQPVKGTEFTPEKRARYDELLAEYRAISEKLKPFTDESGENEGAASSPERVKLEEQRKKIAEELSTLRPKTARHGWVWLFERRPSKRGR